MQGEAEKKHSHGKGRDGDNVPGRIHEYDFFLTREEEGAGKTLPAVEAEERPETTEGKKERNKSIHFFLPE